MTLRSFCVVMTLVFVGLLSSATQVDAQDVRLSKDLERAFSKYETANIKPSPSLLSGQLAGRMQLATASREIEMVLEPNDMRATDFRAENTGVDGVKSLPRLASTTYKGFIDGKERSHVRLNITNTKVEGFFAIDGERFYIEPANKYSEFAAEGDVVIYRSEDSQVKDSFWCHADVPSKIEYGKGIANVENSSSELVQIIKRIDLATEADLQYVNTFGGAAQANNEILAILNMVEGTYLSELNLRIRVVFQHTWTTSDPFAGSTPNDVLNNFRNFWNTNYPTIAVPRTAAHLFTAKSNVLSQGYAYLGVICNNPQASYGLSGYINWSPGKYLITAHELAHNLGANHADAGQSCSNSLMNTQLSGNTPLSFCSFSRTEISNFIGGNGYCMSNVIDPSFDFDGDRRADISVFRPSSGAWYIDGSQNGFNAFTFGTDGDRPVAGDYDGDGKSDAAIYRNGVWWRLLSGTNTVSVVSFGLADDIPVPADYDGDGMADVAVFRPSTGVWHRSLSSTGAYSVVQFGMNGDIPIPGEFTSDGKADVNVFRPSNGVWYRLNSGNGAFSAIAFGMQGDIPVGGDFDGDGRFDRAVFRPSTGVWYITGSFNGQFSAIAFGLQGDIPAPADFDGDGKVDINVFRPSDGVWYRLNSSNGAFSAIQFGLGGDRPIPTLSQ